MIASQNNDTYGMLRKAIDNSIKYPVTDFTTVVKINLVHMR